MRAGGGWADLKNAWTTSVGGLSGYFGVIGFAASWQGLSIAPGTTVEISFLIELGVDGEVNKRPGSGVRMSNVTAGRGEAAYGDVGSFPFFKAYWRTTLWSVDTSTGVNNRYNNSVLNKAPGMIFGIDYKPSSDVTTTITGTWNFSAQFTGINKDGTTTPPCLYNNQWAYIAWAKITPYNEWCRSATIEWQANNNNLNCPMEWMRPRIDLPNSYGRSNTGSTPNVVTRYPQLNGLQFSPGLQTFTQRALAPYEWFPLLKTTITLPTFPPTPVPTISRSPMATDSPVPAQSPTPGFVRSAPPATARGTASSRIRLTQQAASKVPVTRVAPASDPRVMKPSVVHENTRRTLPQSALGASEPKLSQVVGPTKQVAGSGGIISVAPFLATCSYVSAPLVESKVIDTGTIISRGLGPSGLMRSQEHAGTQIVFSREVTGSAITFLGTGGLAPSRAGLTRRIEDTQIALSKVVTGKRSLRTSAPDEG